MTTALLPGAKPEALDEATTTDHRDPGMLVKAKPLKYESRYGYGSYQEPNLRKQGSCDNAI